MANLVEIFPRVPLIGVQVESWSLKMEVGPGNESLEFRVSSLDAKPGNF